MGIPKIPNFIWRAEATNMQRSIQEDIQEVLWGDFASETSFPAKRPLLAHYTSIDVLEKIAIHNELWLSNPLYMNDLEELQFGMNAGADQFRTSAHLSDAVGSTDVYRKLIKYFDSLFNDFDSKHAIDTYVLCFSEHDPSDEDGLLSMWRGYGARGSGVALVLDTAKLGTIEKSPLILDKVQYASIPERLDWIDRKLAELAKALREHPKTDANLELIAYEWIERLKLFSLFTKHKGFDEEREWRVVYISERDRMKSLSSMLSYQITARGVEPKLKLKLEEVPGAIDSSVSLECLTHRIILGPSIATILAANSVRKMLALTGRVELANRVIESSIPFRS
jgi:hypothetical protein